MHVYFVRAAKSQLGVLEGRLDGSRPDVTPSEGTADMPGHDIILWFTIARPYATPGGRQRRLLDHALSYKFGENYEIPLIFDDFH